MAANACVLSAASFAAMARIRARCVVLALEVAALYKERASRLSTAGRAGTAGRTGAARSAGVAGVGAGVGRGEVEKEGTEEDEEEEDEDDEDDGEEDVGSSEVDVEESCRCSGVVRSGRTFPLGVKGGGREEREVEEEEDAAREEADVSGRIGRRGIRTISCGIDSKVVDKRTFALEVNEGDEEDEKEVEVIMSDVCVEVRLVGEGEEEEEVAVEDDVDNVGSGGSVGERGIARVGEDGVDSGRAVGERGTARLGEDGVDSGEGSGGLRGNGA